MLLCLISDLTLDCPQPGFVFSILSDAISEKGSKSPKIKPGGANKKGVNLQKEVSLAAPNPKGPVTRAPGPRGAPSGIAKGIQPGPGKERSRGGASK